jgi:Tol biopolymer transport system component
MRVLIPVAACATLSQALSAQAPSIAPGDRIVVKGMPPVPAALKNEVAPYTRNRAAELLAWHPIRREMLIATFFGDVPQIPLVTAPGGMRRQLTFFDDRPTTGVSYQPANGSYFLFRKDSVGNQNYQIYRYDLKDGAVSLLTDGRSLNSEAVWDRGGRRIAYTSTRRTGKDADLYVLDPLNPASDHMVAALEGGGWAAYDWSPDGRSVLMRQAISSNESHLWVIDVKSGERTSLTPKDDTIQTAYSAPQFTADGAGVFVITDWGSEFRRLARYDVGTHGIQYLTASIPWDVYQYTVSPDGRTLAVITNEDGALILHILDARTGRERSIPNLKGPIAGAYMVAFHRDGRTLGFNLDSGRQTGDAYSLDLLTGKVE